MKKKNYRLLSLLLVVPMFLTACGNGGNDPVNPAEPKVTSVKIATPSETTVLDGTRASLKATVNGDEGISQKVTWTSSDSSVATVTNGVVNFLKVSEEKTVSITATAQADANFKDSVEFTVKHSPFDLKNSRGNPDTSLYLDDGTFIVEDPQDIALIYADVHHTRWYVEATIQLDSFDPNDAWPKFGIMASERDDGMWTHEKSHQVFYYVDSAAGAQSWTAMNAVIETDDLTNWNWGGQIGSATASPSIKKGEPFKMGLMRDGNRFYQLYGKATDVTLGIVGTFEYNSFGEEANYVWVGGWATAATVSDPKCLVGDAIDTMYTVPEGLSLKSSEEVLYLGNKVQIEVSAEGLWNRGKLTFTSQDETIATVDENGVVTAGQTAGSTTIVVGLEGTELSAEFHIVVTDDLLYSVVLDGKMEDAIWSETVKTNSYLLKKNDDYFVRIYGAKNSRGLYLFMDYNVKELANCNPNEWWTWENVEFRLADDEKAWSGQYWVSSMNGGSFVSVGSGEKPEEVFYKVLELGEDGLYHGAFEMFVPYGDDRVAKDQHTYACFGFAPKSGWYNGYNWYANIGEGTLNITANGFAHNDDTLCSEEHAYGEWVTDVAASCSATGSAHRDCAYCGHRDTKVLDIIPDAHAFDYENAEITKAATCIEEGICTATCALCGATEVTALPKDYTNHVDAEYVSGNHHHCESCTYGSYLTNLAGDEVNHSHGGWDNKDWWYDLGVHSGDFVFELEFNMKACQGLGDQFGPGDTCWRTVLPVLYKEGWQSDAATGNRVDHVFRMDWWGWDDGAFSSDANNGVIPDGFDWGINWEAFSNMDIQLTIKKVGAKVTLDWAWTCLATEGFYQGKVFEYHQGCTLVDATKVGVALTAEWTIYTVTKANLGPIVA